MDRVISTTSCSYYIWNGYCQNHRRILPNFLLFVWLYSVEFHRLPCPNDQTYDVVVFADRFRCPLTLFGSRIWIGLSRLLHAHIAYEIYTAKFIAAFCRIFYCLYDYIRLNSIACRVQTTKCTMMYYSLIDSAIHWLCLGSSIDRVISIHSCSYSYESDTAKIIAAFCGISYCLHDLIRLKSIVCHVRLTRYTII